AGMKMPQITRRDFVRLGTGAAVTGAVAQSTLLQPPALAGQSLPGGRTIRYGVVGTGIRGCDLLRSARKVPTGVCVGSADLYSTRLEAGKEAYGADFSTTADYRWLLSRMDVDAILIATSDHHHRRVTLDAVAAGKDVYCEKPMSHNVEDGFAMLEAVQSNQRIFQAGSQRVSSILYAKAREIFASGRLGEVHEIDAQWNRNSPGGAWVYPIPDDASPQTIDWKGFLQDAPDHEFDPKRFFRWRCFRDYGSGLGGDLFVHLLSGIQVITGIHTPAGRAYSSGGLYHFKDGRDFPDLLETLYDFPSPNGGVQVRLHCNQNNNSGDEGLTFYGSTGTMVMTGKTVTFTPQDVRPKFESYGWGGMTEAQRQKGMDDWKAAHPEPPAPLPDAESFSLPQGYDDTAVHLANFFQAVATREHVVEDEVFGNNAAIGCHLANHSYFHKSIATWNAASRTIEV
ncbi:MAG: Gfo/Idh/MocA family oxidoreductase, partial [Terracidiphilus sp.]